MENFFQRKEFLIQFLETYKLGEEFDEVPSHAKSIKLMKDWRMYRSLLKGENCDPSLIKFVEEKISLYSGFIEGKVSNAVRSRENKLENKLSRTTSHRSKH